MSVSSTIDSSEAVDYVNRQYIDLTKKFGRKTCWILFLCAAIIFASAAVSVSVYFALRDDTGKNFMIQIL